MDILDDEIIDLFKALNDHSVKYILVGGFATILNGGSRFTEDVDIWIENSVENRKNLNRALMQTGLPNMPQIETIDFVAGWSSITLSSGFMLDIMTSLKGFKEENFSECHKLANEALIGNVQIKFLHINQLIAEKKATNRFKDLADIEELEKIKKQKGL
ncbi:MAG: hypothetical protein KBG47_01010 [Bacteroidia bacterium]|jgi:predicted nucleotidyltransferase|nr:hypothetical protein [Sphingobacteriaceae bacterium]MBP9068054.1 hypothetical protein [Bacteroidia bacterium]